MPSGRSSRRTPKLHLASWNVQSLVEDAGDARVCRKNRACSSRVDRGLDFLTEELRRFKIHVAGIQETKWFGRDIWTVDGCTFLHSGRPLPGDGEPARRNEGVGIWLNADMSDAWRRGGQQWTGVSSRIVTARLLLKSKDDYPRDRRRTDLFLSIINVYAPTNRAPYSVKDKFFRDLQTALDNVNGNDILVMLGDFNARVGSQDDSGSSQINCVDDQLWGQTLGAFGLGQCNEAGEDLLLFCARNQLSIMNTWFRKKESSRGTWTHPATRQCHLIDYVIMRQRQRVFCQDVGVVRGASFWTDHYMVRSKLRVDFCKPRRTPHRPRRIATQNLAKPDIQKAYQSKLREDPAIATSQDIKLKDSCHQTMLCKDTVDNRKAYRSAQRTVSKAVRKAKDQWVMKVAQEAEAAKKYTEPVRHECHRRYAYP